MKKVEVLLAIEKLNKAFLKLREGIESASTELEKDGVIQRFEFTFELLWKTLRIILEYKGIEVRSPRSAIKEAFKAGLIEDDEILLDMLEDRNLSSHIYSEEVAEQIFKRIEKAYVPALEKLLAMLKERL
jgi:nucleotidyltransferase substrate binding protein (TIGR01987 family)